MMRSRLQLVFRRYPLMTSMSIVYAISGLILLILPRSILAGSLIVEGWVPGIIDWIWPLFYMSGGLLLLRGLTLEKPSSEVAGLILLSFSIFVYVVAIVEFAGLSNVFVTSSIQTGLSIALLSRALWILFGYKQVFLHK